MKIFEQPAISGYRQLSSTEAELINDIKAHAAVPATLLARVQAHLDAQRAAAELDAKDGTEHEARRLQAAEAPRWMAMARSDLQCGLMKLVRAVAQPGGF